MPRRAYILLTIEILSKAIAVLLVFTIAALMVYNQVIARKAVDEATELQKELGPTYSQELYMQAQQYNRDLIYTYGGIQYHPAEGSHWQQDPAYANAASLDAEGLIGSISIPQVNINLPIYHGTDDPTLAKGVGHLYGTSLPVGVENIRNNGQNSVLTSHRGLPTAMLFTRVDELEIGDVFRVDTLGNHLNYRIDTIEVVDPTHPEEYARYITARIGEDRVTLVTCTPFGINTHRLIISAVRTKEPLATGAVLPFPTWVLWGFIALIVVIFAVARSRRADRVYLGKARHAR